MTVLLLAVAGGIGAVSRFLADTFVARHNPFRMPLGTLLINVTGSLVLGLLTGLLAAGAPDSTGANVRAVLGTGFCGGYTTFSTASVESVRLWVTAGRSTGVGYAVATLLGSVAAAGVGVWLGGLL